MQQVPIKTIHLFPKLDEQLIALLRSLTPEEWNKPTIAKLWTVKDIAAHLLDGNIRTLSFSRDQLLPERNESFNSYQELVDYLNGLNAAWVKAMKRMSPQVLTELLQITGKEYCDHLASLNPFGKAIFSVGWAGEEESVAWFHIAREYTEKFIHQLQIREAVNRPGLMTKELFYPFIDTLICGLPHTYRNVNAEGGTCIQLTISSSVGGDWFLTRQHAKWLLSKQSSLMPAASITLTPETAWKLFTKGINAEDAKQTAVISGDHDLAAVALTMISVMA